jgi:hypothetical protein
MPAGRLRVLQFLSMISAFLSHECREATGCCVLTNP